MLLRLPTLMTVLLTGLKLTGYIDWSWWWVFSPIWGVALVMLLLFILIYPLVKLLE